VANIAGIETSTGNQVGLHRMAVVLVCLTVLLLMAGALVTSNEAGDSVPDWPMSFGRWVLGSRQFVGNVRFEYSHRVIAGAVGIFTVLTALWAWVTTARRGSDTAGVGTAGTGSAEMIGTGSGSDRVKTQYKWLALAAVIGVALQAAIGGLRVLLPGHKALIAVPHAFVAQSFFCAVVSLAVITSRSWSQAQSTRLGEFATPLRSLSIATAAGIMVQLLLGAGFRHGAIGIAPHIAGAAGVTLLVGWTVFSAWRLGGADRYLLRPAFSLCALLVVQIGLGIGAYLARLASVDDPQPLEPMISLTVAHVVVGALTLASAVLLALRCNQVITKARSASTRSALGTHASSVQV
jgi:cytochrome c oxidase assembly protein subunit 15